MEARQKVLANHDKISTPLARFKPTVTASAEFNKSHNRTTNIESLDPPKDNQGISLEKHYVDRKYQIEGRLNVFEGWKSINGFKSQDMQIRGLWFDLQEQEQKAFFEIIQIYLKILSLQERIKSVNTTLDWYKRAFDDATERFRVGSESITQVKNAESSYLSTLAQKHEYEQKLIEAQNEFLKLTGCEAGELQELPHPSDRIGSINNLVQEAKDKNPSLQSIHHNYQAAKYEKKEYFGDMMPRVDLVTSVSRNETPQRQRTTPTQGSDKQWYESNSSNFNQNNVSFGANVTWKLYDQGIARASGRLAKEKMYLQRVTLNKVLSELKKDITNALNGLHVYKENLKVREDHIKARELAVEATTNEKEAGTRVLLDVLEAVNKLLQARLELIATKEEYFKCYYSLLNTLGRLNPSYLKLGVPTFNPAPHYERAKARF